MRSEHKCNVFGLIENMRCVEWFDCIRVLAVVLIDTIVERCLYIWYILSMPSALRLDYQIRYIGKVSSCEALSLRGPVILVDKTLVVSFLSVFDRFLFQRISFHRCVMQWMYKFGNISYYYQSIIVCNFYWIFFFCFWSFVQRNSQNLCEMWIYWGLNHPKSNASELLIVVKEF